MLLLYDLRRGGEYPEGVLALCGILRLARLEQCSQQLRPGHACARQYLFFSSADSRAFVPSSVCWRASSATASPTLARTDASVSLARQLSSLARMASRSAGLRVRKRSAVWPEGAFRGFDDCRRKMTAANVRVYKSVVSPCSAPCPRRWRGTYRRVLRQLNLLREAHQEHFGPLRNPFVVQLLLGGGSLHVVGRLEALQQAGQGRVHFGGQDRHGAGVCPGVCLGGVSGGRVGGGPVERWDVVHRQGTTTSRAGPRWNAVLAVLPEAYAPARERAESSASARVAVEIFAAWCFGGASRVRRALSKNVSRA